MGTANGRRKVMVTADPDLVEWVEFNGTLYAAKGMSGYFNSVARSDMESAGDDRMQAFELWKKLRTDE